MTKINPEIAGAMNDIELIVQSLQTGNRIESPQDMRIETAILLVLFVVSGGLLIVDLFPDRSLTNGILQLSSITEERVLALEQMLLALIIIATALYYMAWRRAKEIQTTLGRVLKRNLVDLNPKGIFPDLALKFSMIALVLVLGRPDALAAVLVAFTGDYILQARFFRVPAWTAVLVGPLMYIVAIAMIGFNVATLRIPLACFAFVSLTSIIMVQRKIRCKPKA